MDKALEALEALDDIIDKIRCSGSNHEDFCTINKLLDIIRAALPTEKERAVVDAARNFKEVMASRWPVSDRPRDDLIECSTVAALPLFKTTQGEEIERLKAELAELTSVLKVLLPKHIPAMCWNSEARAIRRGHALLASKGEGK